MVVVGLFEVGSSASTSGRTIYDAAITNTTIDQQKGVFDPTLRFNNIWNQVENPIGLADPLDPANTLIDGTQNEGFGLDLLESEHLHFAHIFVHADPLRQWGVDIHRLACDALALLRLFDEVQRAHIVQPVAQLDQQHTDILAHGEQELAQVLCSTLVLGHLLDLGELGNAVDQPCDIGAEIGLDVLDRRQRILDRVME